LRHSWASGELRHILLIPYIHTFIYILIIYNIIAINDSKGLTFHMVSGYPVIPRQIA
jgi:hypothetical protein